MTEFTSIWNGKEITFMNEGIRYDNKIFINYKDMEDVTHRTGNETALIFKYKGHTVKLPYDPKDKNDIIALMDSVKNQPKPEQVTLSAGDGLEKYSYLDNTAPKEEPPKKKSKTGLIIALGILAALVIAAVIFIL